MPSHATAPARTLDSDFVRRLARFFPDSAPLRIPIRLSRVADDVHGNGKNGASQKTWCLLQETVIEFGTPQEALFLVSNPLEFADRVLIQSRDGSLSAEASIVAVQYHPEQTVVAARFLKPVPNWTVQ